MVDGEQYGELISPQDETTLQLDLPPGKHECYLTVLPKDKDQETYESNILVCIVNIVITFLLIYKSLQQEIDIPPIVDNESEQNQTKEPSNVPVHVCNQFFFAKIKYHSFILESS
jgi:hypothetical protein